MNHDGEGDSESPDAPVDGGVDRAGRMVSGTALDGDEAIAHILAHHASIALASSRQDEAFTVAMDARSLIGQAQGLLMERYDLDARQAFAVLRRYSQKHNVKLHEVAQLLIETRRLPE